ncbi:MAG: pyroglutamyl-peptidase I [Thermomonas sp.]|uniref:pyroglutamyl-peptidase I n=1 Tax=Thermomonas sp. TaxID=1971895 RepID=UPI001EB17671|nr:pyroglutamyl-peptidase I [Thermomonas sp.]MBV2209767.1 pyroglutamyl-peptidase I [Thermomonas sp.]
MPKQTPLTVLVTGFEPFGGERSNPSWEAVRSLQGLEIAKHRIETLCLPVEFHTSLRALRQAISQCTPALVLCVGQAGGRAQLSLERVAINIDDARIADNAGQQPIDAPIIPDGPAAYFTTLPIKAMLLALRHAGIPAEISQTAGTYVCNHVFYGAMHALKGTCSARAGFIHIPFSPKQAAHHPGAPSLAASTIKKGLRIAIETALTTQHDASIAAGAEH